MLADVTPTDYLGWDGRGVAGYIGTPTGRNINSPGAQGLPRTAEPKAKRFAMMRVLLRSLPGNFKEATEW